MLNNYIEFLFKSMLEASGGDLPIWFSGRFREILKDIFDKTGNEVAQRLIYEEGTHGKKLFVDIDEDSIDKVSFLMSNKVEDILGRTDHLRHLDNPEEEKIYGARQRGTMKINRFVNDLFNNVYKTESLSDEQKEENKKLGRKTPAQHLEEFVNAYKAARQPGEFEMVDGIDIGYWYYELNYESQNASLGDSCMKGEECENFFNFYAKNSDKVSMLIMKSRYDDEKIIGRALVWKLTKPEGRTFMDRIYVNYEHDYENFKNYARNKGWFFKKDQNPFPNELIVDTKTNEIEKRTLIVEGMKPDKSYPYLDTIKYYNPDHAVLTNDASVVKAFSTPSYLLEDINGGRLPLMQHTHEDLINLYVDDIMDDLSYYAINIYPNSFWNHIDDKKYLSQYMDGELDHYLNGFEQFVENDEHTVIRFIVENCPKDDWDEEIYSMNTAELIELIDKLDIREDIANALIDHRYKDYTAKDIQEDLYGNTKLDEDMFNELQYYFDGKAFAESVAKAEDEDWLREKYDNED